MRYHLVSLHCPVTVTACPFERLPTLLPSVEGKSLTFTADVAYIVLFRSVYVYCGLLSAGFSGSFGVSDAGGASVSVSVPGV